MAPDTENAVKNGLNRFCQRVFSASPENIVRLTGGANMEIWSFDCAGLGHILRRYPDGNEIAFEAVALTLNDEAEIIALVHGKGVKAPNVTALLEPEDDLGIGFVMERIPGEALPHKLFKDERYLVALGNLVSDAARELAQIHAIKPADINVVLSRQSIEDAIASIRTTLYELGTEIPVYDYALHWLEHNIPSAVEPRLLHGDFRLGNILFDETGISAVLDWELAHIGDPTEDLAWLCMPSWRFGRYDKPVAGIGEIEELLSVYENQSGRTIEPERFSFWLIYSTLRWGMMTLAMTKMWREGLDRSMERALIGTRASEVEIDLLLMLEEEAELGFSTGYLGNKPQRQKMSAEIEIGELAEAAASWVKTDLIPRETGRDQFNARVAAKTLSIIGRMCDNGSKNRQSQAERLKEINLSHEDLCTALYNGAVDLSTTGILDHLRLCAVERLSVYQPQYAGLAAARKKWKIREE